MNISLSEIHERLSKLWEEVEKQGGEMSKEQEERLSSLSLARDIKIAHLASLAKRLQAARQSLEDERAALEQKVHATERELSSLTRFLAKLVGERSEFSCGAVSISWKKSTSLEVDEEELPSEYLSEKLIKCVDRELLQSHLNDGAEIRGARLVEKYELELR